MRRVIIDTDPGIDDTAAIFFALTCGKLRVELLTTVFGNSTIEHTTRNALRILEVAGCADIPVYQGAGRPLLRQPNYAPHVHGADGLGDLFVEPPKTTPANGRAVEQLIAHVMAAPGEIDLLALGPLTNVALALSIEPRLAGALRTLVVMGGAVRTYGNASPVASANLVNDPEAAAIVYRSSAPIVQIGLDVCRPTLITHRHLDRIRAAGNPVADFLMRVTPFILTAYERNEGETMGAHYNDVPAVAYLVDQSLFRGEQLPVSIETSGALTSGQTVVDWRRRWHKEPTAEVCLEVDAARLADVFTEALVGGQVSH